MLSSIHTYELSKRITYEEYLSIHSNYSDKLTDKSKDYIITTFVDYGIRIILSRCKSKEEYRYKDYNKQYKLSIIITPYKLLNYGEHIGLLYTEDDFQSSIDKLRETLKNIFFPTIIDYYDINDFDLKRIDVTTDITMLTAEQINELIRVIKYYDLPSGYRIWIPSDSEKAKCKDYTENLSTYINSDSQGVSLVAYNKEEQIKKLGYNEDISQKAKNILRLEIALKRKWIKKGYGSTDNLSILKDVFKHSSHILKFYFLRLFDDGCYVSKRIASKIIKDQFYNRKKSAEKLLKLQKCIRDTRSVRIGFITAFPGCSKKKERNLYEKLRDIWINPITVDCNYIPSFRFMLGEISEWDLKREKAMQEYIK